MKFSEELQNNLYLPWQYAYLNFDLLKKQLEYLDGSQKSGDASQSKGELESLKKLFQLSLDGEISKVLGFYASSCRFLRTSMDELDVKEKSVVLYILNQKDVNANVKANVLNTHLDAWRAAGKNLSRLLMFVSLNLRAIRKIAKKQQKLVGTLDPELHTELPVTLEIRHPTEDTMLKLASFLSHEDFKALLEMQQHAGLLEAQESIEARILQLKAASDRLKESRNRSLTRSMTRSSYPPDASGSARPSEDTSVATIEVEAQARALRARHAVVGNFVSRGAAGGGDRSERYSVVDTARDSLKRWDSFGSFDSAASLHDSVVDQIVEAREHALRNALLITPMQATMASRAGIFEPPPAPGAAKATPLGLALNLLSVFLYMVNYNLVIPLLDKFCEHLAVDKSVSGYVIGCADIMAIAAALIYSVWTNHSFRQPLLYSAIICVVGNLLVTLAYDVGHLPLLLVGRLLTGAGAARALNRRYIADFVSTEGRTNASIGFVAASAAGMALGPFLSVPLTWLLGNFEDTWVIFGLTFNVITASGWLMVLLWSAFWVVAYLWFEEPIEKKAPRALVGSFGNLADSFLLDDAEWKQPARVQPVTWQLPSSEHTGEEEPNPDGLARSPLRAHPVGESTANDAEDSAVVPLLDGNADVEEDALPPWELDGDPDEREAVESAIVAIEEAPPAFGAAAVSAPAIGETMLPTIACCAILFLLKLLQQGSVSAAPLFTTEFYHWDMAAVGWFLTLMSLAMLPVNFSAVSLTTMLGDRELMGGALVACGIGSMLMVSLNGHQVTLVVYLISFTTVLSFTNILEGLAMSVLSKVLHPSIAKGTFNAGLLSTQFGSLGRLVGNFSIAIFGGIVSGLVPLATCMYTTFTACAILGLAIYYASYSKLQKKNA